MSDRNNDQELEKTTDATADEATSETETNDAIESVPADSMQFSVTFDDVDDEGTVDDGIYSALASAETGETDETSEAEADAIASANASAEVTERNAARVNETLRLAKTDHKDALAEHAEPQGKASEPHHDAGLTYRSRVGGRRFRRHSAQDLPDLRPEQGDGRPDPRARSTSSMARISSAIPDTHTRC